MEFLEVKKDEIKELAQLAGEIWHEYWPCILTEAQINYMVEKFQSEKAIIEQILHQNYSYYFIVENGVKCGYFGISRCKDYLFLSKLYLKKNLGIEVSAGLHLIKSKNLPKTLDIRQ